jgi:hypothetical protein
MFKCVICHKTCKEDEKIRHFRLHSVTAQMNDKIFRKVLPDSHDTLEPAPSCSNPVTESKSESDQTVDLDKVGEEELLKSTGFLLMCRVCKRFCKNSHISISHHRKRFHGVDGPIENQLRKPLLSDFRLTKILHRGSHSSTRFYSLLHSSHASNRIQKSATEILKRIKKSKQTRKVSSMIRGTLNG